MFTGKWPATGIDATASVDITVKTNESRPCGRPREGIHVGVGQRAHCNVCSNESKPNDQVEVLILLNGQMSPSSQLAAFVVLKAS